MIQADFPSHECVTPFPVEDKSMTILARTVY